MTKLERIFIEELGMNPKDAAFANDLVGALFIAAYATPVLICLLAITNFSLFK